VTGPRLELAREQILAFRQAAGGLEARLPMGPESLRQAAWMGLQDSMPRAALLSIHARVEGTRSTTWEDPALVQLWGPRFSAYVVAEPDRAVFSLGRLPDDPAARRRAVATADALEAFLGGRRMSYGEAGRGLGTSPNALRYAAPTGRVLIRWDGARQPTVWMVPPPDVNPLDARLELARRHLHVVGPSSAAAFATWAGVKPAAARAAFETLAGSLVPVRTPLGDAWILAADESALRERGAGHDRGAGGAGSAAGRGDGVGSSGPGADVRARLLPSGDAYVLLQGAERELVVPDAACRRALWPSRVWPGAVLLGGEVVGTWRRADADLVVEPWRRFASAERDAVQAEAEALPLPGAEGRIRVRWVG
jgi:hypothetical protein